MDGFINRLKFILDYLDISASFFADKIGVQRSSLSHLLSGRNKPSVDFILKVNETYPEFNLEWLLKGENNFLIQQETPSTPVQENLQTENIIHQAGSEKNPEFPDPLPPIFKNTLSKSSSDESSEIENIVVFYKNGTFKKYSAQ